jgi:allene oxide cyclase
MNAKYSSSLSGFVLCRGFQLLVATFLVATVGTLGGASFAYAGETLHVVEHVLDEPTIHLGPKETADSMGDINVFANPVFDSTNTRQLGSLQGSCVRVIVGKSWQCSFSLVLASEYITLEGPYNDTGANVFAITGGTGRYAGAKGQMSPHPRESKSGTPTFSDLIFDIR